jgi:hypothetical protein
MGVALMADRIRIASSLPREPDLYDDAIHAKYEGVKLHAWIAAQKLAPLLRKRIKENVLPRPARQMLEKHPSFPGNERTVEFDCNGASLNVKKMWTGIVAPERS